MRMSNWKSFVFPTENRWKFQEIFVAATTDSFSICSEDFVLGMNKMIRCSVDICPGNKVPFFLGRFHDHTDPVPNDVFWSFIKILMLQKNLETGNHLNLGDDHIIYQGFLHASQVVRKECLKRSINSRKSSILGMRATGFEAFSWGTPIPPMILALIPTNPSNKGSFLGLASLGWLKQVDKKTSSVHSYSTPLIAERNPTCNKYCWWFRVFLHHCCLKPCWWSNLSTYQIVHEFLHQQSEVIFNHLFITWREWLLKSSLPILAKL